MLKDISIDTHCRKFAEQRAKGFAHTMDLIKKIDPEASREDKEQQAQKAIANISKDTLPQNNGILLIEVAKLELNETVTQLLNATNLWKLDTLKKAVSLSGPKRSADTTVAILQTVDIKHRDFAQLFQTALKHTNQSYQLNRVREEKLGKHWEIQDDHIISYREPTVRGLPSVCTTFNFLSRSTRTVVWDREMETQDVTQRDFHEYQSGEEIALAYKKLSTFIVDVPEYRGKDDGYQPRRIKRQPSNSK